MRRAAWPSWSDGHRQQNRTGAEVRRISPRTTATSLRVAASRTCSTGKDRSRFCAQALTRIGCSKSLWEGGAEELTIERINILSITSHDQLYAVAEALKNAGVSTDGQGLRLSGYYSRVRDETVARQVLRLCDALEEDDDVQTSIQI